MSRLDWTIFLFITGAILLIATFHSRKVSHAEHYLLAGRNTTLFPLVATLVMTEFNTATLISFSSVGYYARWWALSLPFVFLIGLLFYAFSVAKKWKAFNGISVAGFFSKRYGQDIGRFVSIILFSAMAGFSATYIKSLTLIFQPLFPNINCWLLSAFLILIMLAMTWRGGLIAIIKTDVMSFILILFFFPLLLFFAHHLPNIGNNIPADHWQQLKLILPPKFVISLIFLTMFSYILAPWYGQKIISANSPKTATFAVFIAAFIIFALYSLGVFAAKTIAAKGIILSQPQMALPYLIHHALPPLLQALGYAVLFLTSATTLSGVWSAMVTLLIGERLSHESKKQSLTASLSLTLVCALLSYLLANLFVDQILNKMILANIPIVALSFSLLAGFYWKKATRLGVYISVITGLAWAIACYFHYGEKGIYTWYWAVYGIPLIFITGIVGSLINHKIAGLKLQAE